MGLDINVVKTIINHPFGNGNHTTYTNGDFGDGLLLLLFLFFTTLWLIPFNIALLLDYM